MSKKQAPQAPACDNKQKCPDIGGQAVMEGVMMRSPDKTAIAVRRPDGSIVIDCKTFEPLSKKHKWMGWPIIRGAVSMITMLYYGMKTLETSTKMLGVAEEEPTKFELWLSKKLGKGVDKIVMGMAIFLAVVFSVALFIALPAFIENLLMNKAHLSGTLCTLIGGIVKIIILMGYMVFCGSVPDVRRTFQYHGAEHKTVYCHEHNLPLTPANAQQFTTLHPRCGTAFLLITFIISILVFLLTGSSVIKNFFARFGMHLALLPVVAGISYEVLKVLAHHEGTVSKILRWPGMQMQRLTTRQPDEQMLECAIVAMNCAIYGLPKDCEVTEDGYTRILDYRIADPDMRSQVDEAALKAQDEQNKLAKENEKEAKA